MTNAGANALFSEVVPYPQHRTSHVVEEEIHVFLNGCAIVK